MINKNKRRLKEKTFEIELRKAERGDLSAMCWVAYHLICNNYFGDERNKILATRCLQVLVKHGDIGEPMITLAAHYEYGEGVPVNGAKAIELYTKSYYNTSIGYERVAMMYYSGRAVPKDYSKAWEYLKKAREGRYWENNDYFGTFSNTWYAVGDMYQHGYGVEPDTDEAQKYFEKVIECNPKYGKNEYLEPAMFRIAKLTIDKYMQFPAMIVDECGVCDYKLACKYVDEIEQKYLEADEKSLLRMTISKDELQVLIHKVDWIKFSKKKICRILINDSMSDQMYDYITSTFVCGLSDCFDQRLYIDFTAPQNNGIYSAEIRCKDNQKEVYCVVVSKLEKELERKDGKQYYKVYRALVGEENREQTISSALHKILFGEDIDVSVWEDITMEQYGQDFVNDNVLWLKHYDYCDWSVNKEVVVHSDIKVLDIHGVKIPVGERRLSSEDSPMKPVLCPVCGQFAFAEHDNYDVCPFCGWENCEYDNCHENEGGGPNHVSVTEARDNYKKLGAVNEASLTIVKALREQFNKGNIPHNATMYKHIKEFIKDADPVKMIEKM